MSTRRKAVQKMFAAAALAAIVGSAGAIPTDGDIVIDRALNSPTLTVRYSGVAAALVELRINGASVGTRDLDARRSGGETNFTIALADLKEGENAVEVLLYDRTGKLVGREKTKIQTAATPQGPVFLSAPKMGATLQGPVAIKVGFGRDLGAVYVSFFVDGGFKSMTNFPPFEYLWDTTREANGWHEIEAWAIDDSNSTLKTGKLRVFVNNPGGRTDRPGVASPAGAPSKNPMVETGGVGAPVGPRKAGTRAPAKAASKPALVALAPPAALLRRTVANPNRPTLGATAGLKPLPRAAAIASGPQLMTPTGTRLASVKSASTRSAAKPAAKKSLLAPLPPATPAAAKRPIAAAPVAKLPATKARGVEMVAYVAPAAPPAKPAAARLAIVRGTRLPNVGTFAIRYNGETVNFDVAPRVDEGVPMTPFRYLIEKAGGKVDWQNLAKAVKAQADGQSIALTIGDPVALLNGTKLPLELAPYLDRGRTIVPLSFMRDALNVQVEYDRASGHVLITSAAK